MTKVLLRILIIISFFSLIQCNSNKKDESMIKKELFGKLTDGREAYLFTLTNPSGSQVKLTNYGAAVVSLIVPDRDGKMSDVILGYDDLDGYVNNSAYIGVIVGRYGNRIGKGQFQLDGNNYQLTINDGPNHLHGGTTGYHKVLWNAEEVESKLGPAVKFTFTSPDGYEGFPGTVTTSVTYTWTADNELRIDYTGTTDKTTILNPTNHAYFNLTGDPKNTILDHELMINADSITPVDSTLITTGELTPVENTPMDFRKSTAIGARINTDTEQLKYGKGYDHNWVLNGYSKGKVSNAVALYEPKSGRLMEVLTDQPGMQFYSGNFLNGTITGKEGITYQYRTGLCLEAQCFPDSPNKPQFPSVTLKPGETYKQTTIYKFSVK